MVRRAAASILAVAAVFGWLVSASATPARDGAVIVDSGSTNTPGYRIDVWSDGTATIVVQNRGVSRGAPKSFTVANGVATQFFANLKAVRAGNVAGEPCMKSASFGTTTRVSWHGWTSPDLDCPSDRAPLRALVSSVNAIRQASGIGTLPGPNRGAGGGPLHAEPPPTDTPPPRSER
jgi:hypothetical protein